MEGTRSTGKSNGPETTLRNGNKPSGNEGLKAEGKAQGKMDRTTSDGGSNLETLRQDSKPQPEKVRQAMQDKSVQKKAYDLNLRSEKGGANKEAYPGC